MGSKLPPGLLRYAYTKAADDYLHSLPLEHFMEATAQATQRKITLESLDLVHSRRPDVQVFNELLVQFPVRGRRKRAQVIPDNMVVLFDEPIRPGGSYDLPLQSALPFWVLDYVSQHSKRKDYDVSFRKYERGMKVPYYLLFYLDDQKLMLYQHNGRKYAAVKSNENRRRPLPELELEVGLLDGWVRYWFKGELLPLPADLQRDLDETRRQLAEATHRAETAEQEVARLRAQIEQMRSRRNGGT